MSGICARLRALRESHGLSLRAFVEVLRQHANYVVSHDSVRRYETGQARIPVDFLIAVCRAFQVSADQLMFGNESPTTRSSALARDALNEIASIAERGRTFRSTMEDPLLAARAAWEGFVSELPEDHRLREVIIDSWRRSRDAGVKPTQSLAALRRVSKQSLARRITKARALLDAAAPHLRWLSAVASDTPHVAYIVSADGIVLDSVSNAPDLAASWGLEPGYDWSEGAMGTNGAGTAVATGKVVAVLGPEHYLEPFHGSACLAAPLRDSGGTVIGAVDLSTSVERCLLERLAVVAYVAERIEQDVASAGL